MTRHTLLQAGVATLAALGLAASVPAQAQTTIYVDQVGASNSTTAPSSAGAAIYLDEFNTSGTLGNSYNLSAAGTNTIVDSGSAGSEGALNYSGNYLTFAGYDAAVGTAGVVAGTENRGVGIINLTTGAVDTSTSLTAASSYSANNIRSAVTGDGTNVYTAGTAASGTNSTGGVRFTTVGGTTSSSVENSTNVNTRVVEEFGGNVYFSTGSTTGVTNTGIYELGSATSSASVAPTPVATSLNVTGTTTLASPYAFVFTNSSTLYVADSTSGLVKFVNSGSGFAQTESLAFSNLTGLTVDPLTGVLYGVTGSVAGTNSTLFSITDSGTALTSTVLATASSANYNFRGVQVVDAAPITIAAAPEPSGVVALALGAGALGLMVARRRKVAA